MANSSYALYKKYYIDRQFERLNLFQILDQNFSIKKALYPGSYVHITPSFVFPFVVYSDMDASAKKFFSDQWVFDFLMKNRIYKKKSSVQFIFGDYRLGLDFPNQVFDLLISQYAGFVSKYCKLFLKKGGILVCNNSHGDASMASIDPDFRLVAVVSKRNGNYAISDKNLGKYFIPKKPTTITQAYLQEIKRGIGYKKTADNYIFKKLG